MKSQRMPFWKIERKVQSTMFQRYIWNRKIQRLDYSGYDLNRIIKIQRYWREKVQERLAHLPSNVLV
jgi:hypothetical protein